MTKTAPHHQQLMERIEKASLKAWPGLEGLVLHGWPMRFAKGHTKRANSVSPLTSAPDIEARVLECEAVYRKRGLRTAFKLAEFMEPPLDELLAGRGYKVDDPTTVMVRDLSCDDTPTNMLRTSALDDWLPDWLSCHGPDMDERDVHRAILHNLPTPCFACVHDPDGPASCGLAVLEDGLLGLFDIHTAANLRRKGHATALVRGLLAHGARSGASRAYLQVVDTNEAAKRLYASLGFTPLYRYWYRVSA